MGNGLKVSFLIKHDVLGQGAEGIYRMIPWEVPMSDVQVFDPYQEWLTCIISGLRSEGRDLRTAEHINTLIAVNDQPVFWSAAEHLFARMTISEDKRLKREKHLKKLLTEAGLVYDTQQSSEDVSSSVQTSDRRSRLHS